jgi:aminoglycoside phosphotransferase (APT) family kinase protein
MHDPNEMPSRLASFLRAREPEWRDVEVVSYEVMTGGYSRLLGKAHVRHDGREETVVVRGDPRPDRILIHTDRRQEWEVVRLANEHGVRTPVARWFDDEGHELGTRALVLEFSTSRSFLPYAQQGGSTVGLSAKLAEALASFHRIPLGRLPAQLERPPTWAEYLTRRIDEWRRTADAHVEDLPILRYVAGWLDAHRPSEVPLTLIHGDFQSSNLLITDDGEFEMLDWELASVGDPREDMGYFKAVAQAAAPDLLADAGADEFCARYRQLTGLDEHQLNPAVISYFLILGVVGTVRRLLEGGADFARGTNRLMGSVFNISSVQFGQSMWLAATDALGPVFAETAGAAHGVQGEHR